MIPVMTLFKGGVCAWLPDEMTIFFMKRSKQQSSIPLFIILGFELRRLKRQRSSNGYNLMPEKNAVCHKGRPISKIIIVAIEKKKLNIAIILVFEPNHKMILSRDRLQA